MSKPLELTREEILAFRRRVQSLDQRLPAGAKSIRAAAQAGLQDSMPRAALLSIHARVEGAHPQSWADPALVQVWGPRFSAYAVPAGEHAPFTLGRYPDDARGRRVAEKMAATVAGALDGRRMTDREVARLTGVGNGMRYGTATGTILIRWEGARAPTIWTVSRPDVDPKDARLDLARRYLHVFGPTTADSFAKWAGIGGAGGLAAFDALGPALIPARTPIGDAWLLARDEAAARAPAGPTAAARLLPSGDTYFLLWRTDRELLVPDPRQRDALWTSRVWPGAVLVNGDIVGVWRRAGPSVTVETWRKLSAADRQTVEAEAATLPLPDLTRPISVSWDR